MAALRASFMATMKDEAFLAAAAKVNADINPIPGEELQRTVERALTTPEPVLAKLRDYLGYEK